MNKTLIAFLQFTFQEIEMTNILYKR